MRNSLHKNQEVEFLRNELTDLDLNFFLEFLLKKYQIIFQYTKIHV